MPKFTAQAAERALIGAVNDYRTGRLDRAEAACKNLLRRDEGNAAAHQLLAVVKLSRATSTRDVPISSAAWRCALLTSPRW